MRLAARDTLCMVASTTPVSVVVQRSIMSPLESLEINVMVSVGLTVGGRMTLPKEKEKELVMLLDVVRPLAATIISVVVSNVQETPLSTLLTAVQRRESRMSC